MSLSTFISKFISFIMGGLTFIFFNLSIFSPYWGGITNIFGNVIAVQNLYFSCDLNTCTDLEGGALVNTCKTIVSIMLIVYYASVILQILAFFLSFLRLTRVYGFIYLGLAVGVLMLLIVFPTAVYPLDAEPGRDLLWGYWCLLFTFFLLLGTASDCLRFTNDTYPGI
ncbi:uncharacterized protein LOC131940937 [Physella acuta]|uniref:uncharacterized protein LOC131940937 n=1 Tax=Physella acuta TaxID=109671 RepID=UPI0027DDCF4C|nr:uncharacterized protein LOC131940937 [Physella acuta]